MLVHFISSYLTLRWPGEQDWNPVDFDVRLQFGESEQRLLEVAVKPMHENEGFVLFSASIALRGDGFAKIGFTHHGLIHYSKAAPWIGGCGRHFDIAGLMVGRHRDDKLRKVECIGAVRSEYVTRRNLARTRGRHIDLQRLFARRGGHGRQHFWARSGSATDQDEGE
ncbi:hypothetical protein ABIA95_002678 [Bradyrhizobium sp. LA8.1]|uniref:hypothetical protein n=1 Tax=unclassified Bradyrhizobium TaxID=2631580 RepID=UPI003392EBA2